MHAYLLKLASAPSTDAHVIILIFCLCKRTLTQQLNLHKNNAVTQLLFLYYTNKQQSHMSHRARLSYSVVPCLYRTFATFLPSLSRGGCNFDCRFTFTLAFLFTSLEFVKTLFLVK
jgi:hypothetical protein